MLKISVAHGIALGALLAVSINFGLAHKQIEPAIVFGAIDNNHIRVKSLETSKFYNCSIDGGDHHISSVGNLKVEIEVSKDKITSARRCSNIFGLRM